MNNRPKYEGAWVSNSPKPVKQPSTGFEDRGIHRDTSTLISDFTQSAVRYSSYGEEIGRGQCCQRWNNWGNVIRIGAKSTWRNRLKKLTLASLIEHTNSIPFPLKTQTLTNHIRLLWLVLAQEKQTSFLKEQKVVFFIHYRIKPLSIPCLNEWRMICSRPTRI